MHRGKKSCLSYLVLVAVFLLAGCSGGSGDSPGSTDENLVGSWRIILETVYWDSGLSQSITPVTTTLELNSNGQWDFGSSSGSWSVASIEDADWTEWDTSAGDQTRKIVLSGWDGDPGTGPIDEPTGVVDNIWVVYRTSSEVNGDGTIWMKFWKTD